MNNFCEMNIEFINYILLKFEIQTKTVLQSELRNLSGTKNELLISVGKSLGASIYLSGNGARSYNEEEKFKNENIFIEYQDFKHPNYSQLFPPFTPYLSIVDLLFNEGTDGAKQFLKK